MPEPPQLAPLDVEEQRLYSELLPGDRAPHPISKGAPHHPVEETHFGRLYPFFFFSATDLFILFSSWRVRDEETGLSIQK